MTVRSMSNVDGSAVADGSAVEAGAVGVGAAVSVNTVDTTNKARMDGTVAAADGMLVEALMADRAIGISTDEIEIVDIGGRYDFPGYRTRFDDRPKDQV